MVLKELKKKRKVSNFLGFHFFSFPAETNTLNYNFVLQPMNHDSPPIPSHNYSKFHIKPNS